MNKSEVMGKIKQTGLLAVIRGPSEELTIKLVEALIAGGVKGIEITYTTPNSEQVVVKLKQTFEDEIVLGMGTVTDKDQPKAAKTAGAKFLVSPIMDDDLVEEMIATGLVTMCGALTPTEIFSAYKKGVDVVKVFPGSLGGTSYLKAIKGPFPQIPLMPTGGVSLQNIPEWFSVGVIAVGVGSELCPKQLILERKFDKITELAKKFREVVDSSLRK